MTEQAFDLPGEYANLRHRPALDALKREQKDLIQSATRGLMDRRDVLLWLQRTSVLTFGKLPDEWFGWVGSTRHITAALLEDEEKRSRLVGETSGMSDQSAMAWRVELVEQHIDPACSKSLAHLAKHATQYESNTGTNLPEAQKQTAPGMRPVLQDLEEQQRAVLRDMLDGFESVEEIRGWVPELREATEQLLPSGYMSVCTRHPLMKEALLGGEERFHTRASLAAANFLPLMNKATRKTVATANEYVEERGTRHSPTKGF